MIDNSYILSVEQKLSEYIPADIPLEREIKYSLLGGGKRFRAHLCFAVADIFNASEKSFSSSCALEMIHAYSLIHDDLPAMDNDDMRRGKPTSHKQFDESSAILTGDCLQSLAFKIISDDENLSAEIKIKLLQILTNASFEMVLGQQLDMQSSGDANLLELEKINRLKTGALLKASVLMGATIAKVDDKIYQYFDDFASDLALAYQVQDDSFDDKKSSEIGKTNNSQKTTFVDLLGTEKAQKYYQDLYDSAKNNLQKIDNSQKLQDLLELMKNRKF